jgi:tetratricopeptide (TPR) repeat protein
MSRKKEYISGKRVHQENNSRDDSGMPLKPEDKKLADEISDIKNESNRNDIDKITAGWVREWDEKQLNRISPDVMSDERKEYITNALVEAENDFERKAHARKRKPLKKIFLARYVLSAAAVLTGALFLIKMLLPSGNPDMLFNKYYEPISAISPVTRSADAGGTNSYASAIESYNNKNYQAAAAGFSDAILKDPLNSSPRFFLGITRIALGNYEQAENMLEEVILNQGEYEKEANWYLGLAYLKTGDSEKAEDCFELLAQSPGFYRDRAEKILRRLR